MANLIDNQNIFLKKTFQLEQRICDNEIKDKSSVFVKKEFQIFKALSTLRKKRQLPDFLKTLDFPEKYLYPHKEKQWYQYEKDSLTQKHPLFATLQEKVQTIDELLKAKKYESMTDSLKKISLCYKTYIEAACQSKGKARTALFQGPARLIAKVNGFVTCKNLTQERGRALISRGPYFGDTRSNKHGSSAVYHDQENNVFYKRAVINPLTPGKEYAVTEFNYLFFGFGAPPTSLFKVQNVFIREPQSPAKVKGNLFINLLSRNTSSETTQKEFIESHAEFKSHPFKEHHIQELIQASIGIKGQSFHTFLQKADKEEVRNNIDPYNFSTMVILALTLRPDDARADNYILQKGKNGKKASIIGVDNDRVMNKPTLRSLKGTHVVRLRTVLFLLPMMEDIIDEKFVENFIHIDIEAQFFNWLQKLRKYNTRFVKDLHTSGALSMGEIKDLDLPLRLSDKNLFSLYHTMKLLQQSLIKNPKQTHNDLFKLTFPLIHETYQVALNKTKGNILEAQRLFFQWKTLPIEELLEKPIETIKKQAQSLPGQYEEQEKHLAVSIEELTPLFLKKALAAVDGKKQLKIVKESWQKLPQNQSLPLVKTRFADHDLLELIEDLKPQEVIIEEASEITPNGVVTLMSRNPHLKVVLGKNKKFNGPSIIKTIEFAKKEGRSLFYKIGRGKYSLTQKDLTNLMLEALKLGDIPLATALTEFGVNLQRNTDKKGSTLFHLIAEKGRAESLHFLAKIGFSVHMTNSDGDSPLHFAARGNRVENLRALFEIEEEQQKEGGLELRNKKRETPFNTATSSDAKAHDAGAFLLEKITQSPQLKKHLRKDPEGYTPLHLAAKYGMKEAAKLFLKTFDINTKGYYDRTPLHMASFNSQLEMAQFLLENGADVNAQAANDASKTPLHDATLHADLAMVKLLVAEKKLDFSKTDVKGDSPLRYAVEGDLVEIATLLLTHPNYSSPQKGPNSLDELIERGKKVGSHRVLPILYTQKSLEILKNVSTEGTTLSHYTIIQKLYEKITSTLLNPKLKDLSKETIYVAQDKGTKQLLESTYIPLSANLQPEVFEIEGKSYSLQNPTLGDGACAIHALIGQVSSEGWWTYISKEAALKKEKVQEGAKKAFLSALADTIKKGKHQELVTTCLKDFFSNFPNYKKEREAIQKAVDEETKKLSDLYLEIIEDFSPSLMRLIRRGAKKGTKKFKEWESLDNEELVSLLKKNPQACFDAFEPIRDLLSDDYLSADHLSKLKKTIQERENKWIKADLRIENFLLKQIDTYKATALSPSYYLTDNELALAAHLFNKKLLLLSEESKKPRILGAKNGQEVVIYHKGVHYSRLTAKQEPKGKTSTSAASCSHLSNK
ncbi:ankyrin repeat domain-containing protein [Candidatus Neptunochlamydia vexilliferae]|nr:ankyrin repeat domain-containing protein [Candidatus Neptunochlamydia vexilliferae]